MEAHDKLHGGHDLGAVSASNKKMTASCFPPFICCGTVAFIYTVYILYELLPQAQSAQLSLDKGPLPTVVWVGASFHVVVTLFAICFMRAMCTPLDSIPKTKSWMFEYPLPSRHNEWLVKKICDPNCEITDRDVQLIKSLPVIERKHGVGEVRKCKPTACNMYKPDRCHHCRVCNTCVLRMDHHCPWIANCVGFHNYKFFLLLLFYGCVCTGFVLVSMFPRFVRVFRMPPVDLVTFFSDDFPVAVAYIISAFLCALLLAFLSFHLYLAMNSMTTIELKEKKNHLDATVQHRFKIAHLKYDKGGYYSNLVHVMGSPWMWLLPIHPVDSSRDDGTYSMNLPAPPVAPPP